MENNYLSIALNDYEYALRSRYPGFNNNIVSQYQQVCEKLLKYVITCAVPQSDLLRSRNLKRLYDAVKQEIVISRESELFLSVLTDFYFDARYPGDDFVNVSDEDTDFAYKAMVELHDAVVKWNEDRETNRNILELLTEGSSNCTELDKEISVDAIKNLKMK